MITDIQTHSLPNIPFPPGRLVDQIRFRIRRAALPDNAGKFLYDSGIVFRPVRCHTVGTVLYAIGKPFGVADAARSKIERAIAEKAVEGFWICALMTREIVALKVSEKAGGIVHRHIPQMV